jgi:hypothetical protein
METTALQALMVELFAAIQLVSAYPQPSSLPEVHAVPAEVMQQKICGRPCPVKAFYHPEWGVYIDREMDVFGDPFARSILLHELVHHLQRTSGKFQAVPGDCRRKNAEELEAYEIQNRYLSRIGVSKRALAVGRAQLCRDEIDR